MLKKSIILLFIGILCSSILPGLTMANIVANGSFETGDFSSWAANEVGIHFDINAAQSGSYSAVWQNSSAGSLSQTLDTVAGQSYIVEFWTSLGAGFTGDGSFFTAQFGDSVLVNYSDLSDPNNWDFPPNYQHFLFELAAVTTNDTLTFSFYSPEAEGWLDNISVSPVPIPGALLLLGSGLLGAAGVRFRSKRSHR